MPKAKKKRSKLVPKRLVVTYNDIEEVENVLEIEEWTAPVSLDIVKTFHPKKLKDAVKSADTSASGSNVDFVVYELREVYRAKCGF